MLVYQEMWASGLWGFGPENFFLTVSLKDSESLCEIESLMHLNLKLKKAKVKKKSA